MKCNSVQRIVVPALTMLLCVTTACGASVTIATDSRLAAETSLRAYSTSVRDVLASQSSSLGVPLAVDPLLADGPVSIGLGPRPAREALQLVADLLLAEWVPDGEGYRLTLSELGKRKEGKLAAERNLPTPNVIALGDFGRNYSKVLPRAGDEPVLQSPFGNRELSEWPHTPKDVDSLPDWTLAELRSRLRIEYLATRYDDRLGCTFSGRMSFSQLIEGTARMLDATWERVGGVYLFRERDWLLKRERRIPESFFARWTARLSPDKHLSLDDLAAAAAELTPEQKHWWLENGNRLPLKPYRYLLAGDREHAFDLWRQFTPEQKQKMKITYDPSHEHDVYAGGAGISVRELNSALREQLIGRLKQSGYGDMKLGWMHYRVSDGYERDRLDYIVTGTDGQFRQGGCFFELFHPKPEEWLPKPVGHNNT
jgi:hypothetical protein